MNDIQINTQLTEEESITVKSSDYIFERYFISPDDKTVKFELQIDIPSSASRQLRGKVGEEAARKIMEIDMQNDMELLLEQKPGHVFDFEGSNNHVIYDVKTSRETTGRGPNGSFFKFFISSGRPFKGAIRKSPSKYKKDYKKSGIDYLICIGIYNDVNKKPDIFLIPTDCKEVIEYDNITIAASGRSKYEKYRVNFVEFTHLLEEGCESEIEALSAEGAEIDN